MSHVAMPSVELCGEVKSSMGCIQHEEILMDAKVPHGIRAQHEFDRLLGHVLWEDLTTTGEDRAEDMGAAFARVHRRVMR